MIAAAVIAGVKIAHVARQLGVSRSWASREANSAGVRNIIADVIMQHREDIERIFVQARRVHRYRGPKFRGRAGSLRTAGGG